MSGNEFTQEDVNNAYKKRMREVHFNKVASMDDDFKKMAEIKSKNVNSAYDYFKKYFKKQIIMPLSLPPYANEDLTPGERTFLNRMRAIYDNQNRNSFLYIQPRIGQLEPDFVLIDPHKGVLIVEVKDWSLSYITHLIIERPVCQMAGEVITCV